ncbi:hypothetical protein BB561_004128 [Smittium simulii]|uniref:Peptidase S1 domain-containing protein n=1 Tax=Smittium simulii TaxID=133385 RepID=A0A2T9YHU1_9FUNG|nr:hypothetical protein BB561_004128 [Smittium simulii]
MLTLKKTIFNFAFLSIAITQNVDEYIPANFKQRLEASGYSNGLVKRISNLSKPLLSKRITNGEIASISDYPYAGFILKDIGYGGDMCGSSLIAPNVLLTAAHCVTEPLSQKEVHSSRVTAIFGLNKVVRVAEKTYTAKRIARHVDYDQSGYKNDIALVFLDKDVPSSIATPIEIYRGNVTDDLKVHIAGWGALSKLKNAPKKITPTLYSINIQIHSSDLCSSKNSKWDGSNNGNTICTINTEDKGVCIGDSGSSLVTGKGDSAKIVGIASTISTWDPNAKELKCGVKNDGAYFVNANYYSKWINEEITKFKNSSEIAENADFITDYYFKKNDILRSKSTKTE